MRTKLLLCAFLVAGCAGPSSQQMAAVHYSGEPFDLAEHGSRITGQVCGMDLTVDVTRSADAVELTGFLDGRYPVHLTARPAAVGRTIQGALGTAAGDAAVDVRFGPRGLDGRVGWRRFELKPQGDALAGTMQIAGSIEPSEAVVQGQAQLMSMPLETQAALVPALLTCNVQKVGRWGRSSLYVRVGGPAGALPHGSSSVYTRD
jgi:hypothetical protein